jgi:hypothetical protein
MICDVHCTDYSPGKTKGKEIEMIYHKTNDKNPKYRMISG